MGYRKNINIIEFNGVPGVGKTTISMELIDKLQGQGFNVLNFSTYRKNQTYNFIGKNLKRMKLVLFNLDMILWIFKLRPYNYIYRLKHLLDALTIEDELDKLNKNYMYDFIIVEQGIIQALSAVLDANLYKNNHTVEKFLRKIYKKYNIEIISCSLEVDLALNRLKTRNRFGNYGKLDSLDDKKILNSLYKSIEANLKNLTYYLSTLNINIIELNTNKKVTYNVDNILNNKKWVRDSAK